MIAKRPLLDICPWLETPCASFALHVHCMRDIGFDTLYINGCFLKLVVGGVGY